MSLAIRLVPDIVRSVPFGSISAIYMGIGTAMTKPIRVFMMQNMTDEAMMFSFDGVNDHFPLPATSYFVFDITSNKTIQQGFFLAQGQRIYVKQLDPAKIPSSGAVYLSTFYGADLI